MKTPSKPPIDPLDRLLALRDRALTEVMTDENRLSGLSREEFSKRMRAAIERSRK